MQVFERWDRAGDVLAAGQCAFDLFGETAIRRSGYIFARCAVFRMRVDEVAKAHRLVGFDGLMGHMLCVIVFHGAFSCVTPHRCSILSRILQAGFVSTVVACDLW